MIQEPLHLEVTGVPCRRPVSKGVAVSDEITEVTRRHIIDAFPLQRISWSGNLSEPEFLARIYNLSELPSTDSRYDNAYEDIQQHRVRNPQDWDDDYVFTDPRFNVLWGTDENFLHFLEMTVHPLVRGVEQAAQVVDIYNAALRADGYHLVPKGDISGRPTYKALPLQDSFHGDVPEVIATQPLLTDAGVLHEHLQRIKDSLTRDPANAIASSKELLESLFKLILDQENVEFGKSDDIPTLYKKVGAALNVNAESVPASTAASQTIQKLLRTLATTVQSIAELRNEIGTGHGRIAPSIATEMHARLALNSTVTVAEFLLGALQQRRTNAASETAWN